MLKPERRTSRLGGGLLMGLLIVALPALQAHLNNPLQRSGLLFVSILLAYLGAKAYGGKAKWLVPRGSLIGVAVGLIGLLYSALIVWNIVFLEVDEAAGYDDGIFRGALTSYRSPIYGVPETPNWTDFLLIGIPLLVVGIFYRQVVQRRRWSIRACALMICAFQLVMISAFALTQSSDRLLGDERDYISFALPEDLAQFDSLPAVFADWNETMPDLHQRNRHYPPGNLFMMKLGTDLGWDGMFRAVVVAATLATTLLMVPLSRLMGLSERSARMAMLLLATSTGPLVFPTSFTAPLTMFFAAAVYVSLLAALEAPGKRYRFVFAGGFTLAVCALFSFVVFAIGLVVGSILLFRLTSRQDRPADSVRVAAEIVGVMGGTLVLVRIGLGFDILECLSIARSNAEDLMAQNPFGQFDRYLLRSTGNILAYLTYTGAVLSSLAAASLLRRFPRQLRIMARATLVALVVCGFMGQFWLETERIWVFFTPLLAALAAGALDEANPSERVAAISGNTLTSSAQELWHLHYV